MSLNGGEGYWGSAKAGKACVSIPEDTEQIPMTCVNLPFAATLPLISKRLAELWVK